MFSAAKGLEGEILIRLGHILEMPGIALDQINKVSCPYRLAKTPIEQLNLVQIWRDFLDLKDYATEPYAAVGSLESAFLTAMFGDKFHAGSEYRLLKSRDIKEWGKDLKETSRRRREEGPGGILKLNPAMSPHAVAVLRRRHFMSTKDYIGLCPERAGVGDRTFVPYGSSVPTFLRLVGETSCDQPCRYRALGHGDVHRLMNGEAVQRGLPTQQALIV